MRAFLLIFIFFLHNTCTIRIVDEEQKKYNYCIVEEPTHHHLFDFTKLSSDTLDKQIRLDEHSSFRIQFCRPLIKPCNGKPGYSACYNRSGTEVGIGTEPPQVDLSDGKIVFRYTGDTCNATHNYTLNVKMNCNYMMTNEVAVDMDGINRTSENCNFNLGLDTYTACTLRNYTDCTVERTTGRYNLNPLSDFTKNYEVPVSDYISVILNVCHSLLYGPHYVNCSSDSSICLIDKANKTHYRYLNIGQFEEYPIIKVINGENLLINYKSNVTCLQKQTNTAVKIKSRILFVCDLNATDSLPEIVGGLNSCQFNFVWRTIVACSEKVLHDQSLINRDYCTVKDPLTQYEYDLSGLTKNAVTVKSKEGSHYEIGVCRFLNHTVCKTGSGVCKLMHGKRKLGVSGGMANGKLMWSENGPYLNYSDGNLCSKGTKKYTVISFLCFEEDRVEVEDKPCHTNINWYTTAVCKRPCAMSLYDMNFEKLVRWKNDYLVKTNGSTVYRLNVCRPLVDGDHFKNCSNGVGICKTNVDEDGKATSELNLGYPDQNPLGESDGSVVLTYKNGALCEEDEEQRISSQIKFVCDLDHSEDGPRFVNYDNCTYYFEWRTKLSCGTVPGKLNDEKCQVTNVLGHMWDLSGLNKKDFYKFRSLKRNQIHTMGLSLCGGKKVCNDSYICDGTMSYGRNVTVTSDYRTNTIKFHFTNGSQCEDGSNAQAILYIKCNESTVVGEPIVLSDQHCKSVLEWSFNAICKPQNLQIHKGTVIANDRTDSRLTSVQIVFILLLLTLTASITICHFRRASRRVLFTTYFRNLMRRFSPYYGEYPSVPLDEALDDLNLSQ